MFYIFYNIKIAFRLKLDDLKETRNKNFEIYTFNLFIYDCIFVECIKAISFIDSLLKHNFLLKNTSNINVKLPTN